MKNFNEPDPIRDKSLGRPNAKVGKVTVNVSGVNPKKLLKTTTIIFSEIPPEMTKAEWESAIKIDLKMVDGGDMSLWYNIHDENNPAPPNPGMSGPVYVPTEGEGNLTSITYTINGIQRLLEEYRSNTPQVVLRRQHLPDAHEPHIDPELYYIDYSYSG